MSSRRPRRDGRTDLQPGRIAILYGLVGVAWIFGSSLVVQALTNGQSSEVIEIGKGTGFIGVTAVALYALVARRARSIRVAESARLAADEQRVRLATAVEQAAEAIVITDREARILYVNPAFERVSGYDKTELVGGNPRLLQSGRQVVSSTRRCGRRCGPAKSGAAHFSTAARTASRTKRTRSSARSAIRMARSSATSEWSVT